MVQDTKKKKKVHNVPADSSPVSQIDEADQLLPPPVRGPLIECFRKPLNKTKFHFWRMELEITKKKYALRISLS